eukprot:7677961-Pyramimonas_sp.AAC.1
MSRGCYDARVLPAGRRRRRCRWRAWRGPPTPALASAPALRKCYASVTHVSQVSPRRRKSVPTVLRKCNTSVTQVSQMSHAVAADLVVPADGTRAPHRRHASVTQA